jgi:alginate O-acetyltransferase complex protein AlgI
MLFTEARFLAFFLAVFAAFWTLRGRRARTLLLLGASYAFYACFDARFLVLLGAQTLCAYACGVGLARASAPGVRRRWLWTGLAGLLAPLLVFKYGGFLVESTRALSAWLGLVQAGGRVPALLLPVGISFTTFQALGYVIDVYRGRIPAERDALDLALFVAFFPQLLAGPISRGRELLPQIRSERRFDAHVAPRALLGLYLVGFLKKACVADGIAPLVDPVFAAPGEFAAASAWLALALYHVQIYCDFSGYSDMAVACGGLLGYRLPRNFAFPYLAGGIGDFWRRWHVSLSSWMRDQIYLPLLGRKPSGARRILALYVTLGACGAWHGAGWPFVAFGLLHGTYLVAEELWRRAPFAGRAPATLVAALGVPATNLLVMASWPVFRLASLGDARVLYGTLAGAGDGARTLDPRLAWLVAGCALAHVLAYAASTAPARARVERLPRWAFPLAYGLAWALVLPWVAAQAAPFIYSRF